MSIENDLSVSAITVLREKLAAMNAQPLWHCTESKQFNIMAYRVRGVVVILQTFSKVDGYELYAPVDNSNSAKAVMDWLEAL